MSSKDLNGLKVLEEFIKAGIDSIKVEGRMKSHLYAGTMSKVYAEALNYYRENGHFLSEKIIEWEQELKKVTHRSYSQANLMKKADASTIFNEREHDGSINYVMVGRIVDQVKDKHLVVEVRNAFNKGDTLEILPFKGKDISIDVKKIYQLNNEEIERTKPTTLVKIPYAPKIENNNILRMKVL